MLTILAVTGCGQDQNGQKHDAAKSLLTHLEHLRSGDFTAACELIDPAIRDYGQPCAQQLQLQWPADKRAELDQISLDSSQAEVLDSTHVRIPAAAITYHGQPSQDGDYELKKLGDQWVLG